MTQILPKKKKNYTWYL